MLNITWFDEQDISVFPDPSRALKEPDGLLATGGNLSLKTLTQAYRQGIFPWFEQGQAILWWSPAQRAVIETDHIHIAKNMRKLINRGQYTIKADTNFNQVLQQCSQVSPTREATWITPEMQAAYQRLFEQNLAHSVEVYNAANELVGGLYGVFIRNCFCGESMFSREPNTSKLALIALSIFLRQNQCRLIDCQLPTPHLLSMGATVIPRRVFITQLSTLADNLRLSQRSWVKLWQL